MVDDDKIARASDLMNDAVSILKEQEYTRADIESEFKAALRNNGM